MPAMHPAHTTFYGIPEFKVSELLSTLEGKQQIGNFIFHFANSIDGSNKDHVASVTGTILDLSPILISNIMRDEQTLKIRISELFGQIKAK